VVDDVDEPCEASEAKGEDPKPAPGLSLAVAASGWISGSILVVSGPSPSVFWRSLRSESTNSSGEGLCSYNR
jgi:hypothetical protein